MKTLIAILFVASAFAQESTMTLYQRQLKIDVIEVFQDKFTDPYRCSPVVCGTTDGTGHFYGYTSARDGFTQERTLEACLERSSLGAVAASPICQQALVCTELPVLSSRCYEHQESAILHLAYNSNFRRRPQDVRLTGSQALLHSSRNLHEALAPARRDLLTVFAGTFAYANQCGQVSCATSNGDGLWFASNDWTGDSAETVVTRCVQRGFSQPADVAGLISAEEKESICRAALVCNQPQIAPRVNCATPASHVQTNQPVPRSRRR